MEELGSNGIKIYTFPSGEQPVGELNAKMNVSNLLRNKIVVLKFTSLEVLIKISLKCCVALMLSFFSLCFGIEISGYYHYCVRTVKYYLYNLFK